VTEKNEVFYGTERKAHEWWARVGSPPVSKQSEWVTGELIWCASCKMHIPRYYLEDPHRQGWWVCHQDRASKFPDQHYVSGNQRFKGYVVFYEQGENPYEARLLLPEGSVADRGGVYPGDPLYYLWEDFSQTVRNEVRPWVSAGGSWEMVLDGPDSLEGNIRVLRSRNAPQRKERTPQGSPLHEYRKKVMQEFWEDPIQKQGLKEEKPPVVEEPTEDFWVPPTGVKPFAIPRCLLRGKGLLAQVLPYEVYLREGYLEIWVGAPSSAGTRVLVVSPGTWDTCGGYQVKEEDRPFWNEVARLWEEVPAWLRGDHGRNTR